eukprot:c20734_g1_i1 orf=347-730(+)
MKQKTFKRSLTGFLQLKHKEDISALHEMQNTAKNSIKKTGSFENTIRPHLQVTTYLEFPYLLETADPFQGKSKHLLLYVPPIGHDGTSEENHHPPAYVALLAQEDLSIQDQKQHPEKPSTQAWEICV